jgi:Ca2+-binding EF-hand superfamily protein
LHVGIQYLTKCIL